MLVSLLREEYVIASLSSFDAAAILQRRCYVLQRLLMATIVDSKLCCQEKNDRCVNMARPVSAMRRSPYTVKSRVIIKFRFFNQSPLFMRG